MNNDDAKGFRKIEYPIAIVFAFPIDTCFIFMYFSRLYEE